ncbi:DUF305 domain-containing protein [Herpetosiphon gulosus]|uniref:DUF305 domain-containing protein n=1 Tax=Herpetosiphon gulosus TaxID=1973496 RepID=A0ABP9WYB8_9CHLR
MRRLITFVSLIVVLTGCGATSQTSSSTNDHGGDHSTEAPTMDHGSMSMSDLQFLDGMIEHHRGAIAMAKDAQNQASDPRVQELAKQIIAAQEPEIVQLQAWRKQWFGDAPDSDLSALHMGSMDVSAGSESYDRRFLTAMISHHDGAIAMAQSIKVSTQRAELKTFAEAVITAQTAENQQMDTWLQEIK